MSLPKSSDVVRQIAQCEVCGNSTLDLALDLGDHPMCDDLVLIGDSRSCELYPIQILYCTRCRTAHQGFQVPKERLFPPNYHYRARLTADVLQGMSNLVASYEQRFGDLQDKFVLDVGCNDGSLLSRFRARGAVTAGVEPTAAAMEAIEDGHDVYNDFMTPEVAARILADRGHPDVITFTNVFAHIEDLPQLLDSLRCLMSRNTVLVIENHYLGAILSHNQFDTFYHEHPRTYSLSSFLCIAEDLEAQVHFVDFPARYGGNIRVFLSPSRASSSGSVTLDVANALLHEANFLERFSEMKSNIARWQEKKQRLIARLVTKYGPLTAKAFPGRAAILVKLLELDVDSVARVHEKPDSQKVGHYLPGTRIPIVSDDVLNSGGDASRPILNMAWHIPDEIRRYLSGLGHSGPVIDIVTQEDFV